MEKILERINTAGLRLLRPLTLSETFDVIAQEAVQLTEADWGSLFIGENKKLTRVAVYPKDSPILYEPRKHGYTYKTYSQRKIFVFGSKEIVAVHHELENKNFNSAVSIPISYHKQNVGAIFLLSQKPHRFSKKELDLLKIFGNYASLAISSARSRDELQKALETRNLFISMASHELRTPLTSINGYVQLLNAKLAKGENSEARWIKELTKETTRLINLTKELFQINNIKAGQLHYSFSKYQLTAVIKDALKRFYFAHSNRLVVLKLKQNNGWVVCDYEKMLQVFINLLDNAAKFSPKETEIVITLDEKPSSYLLRIQDKGFGIPKDELPKIFDEFYRGNNNSTDGLGIGLYLTKTIVEKHNGTISVKSKVNKGTKFEIKLPKAKE